MAGLLFARAGVPCRCSKSTRTSSAISAATPSTPRRWRSSTSSGCSSGFLERPHNKVDALERDGRDATGRSATCRISPACRFIAMMPQWEFLDFLRPTRRGLPGFRTGDGARRSSGFVEEAGRVAGVRLRDGREQRAPIDHRRRRPLALVRRTMLPPVEDLGAPMDVFWFRLAKRKVRNGPARQCRPPAGCLVMIDRGDYWQCAYLIPKGPAEACSRARDRRDPRGSRGGVARSPSEARNWTTSATSAHRQARPADDLAPAGLARDRRCRPRHVADRRDRHQPRDPGRGCRRQCLAGPWRAARTMSSAAVKGAGAAPVPDPRHPGRAEGSSGAGSSAAVLQSTAPIRRCAADRRGCSTVIRCFGGSPAG